MTCPRCTGLLVPTHSAFYESCDGGEGCDFPLEPQAMCLNCGWRWDRTMQKNREAQCLAHDVAA